MIAIMVVTVTFPEAATVGKSFHFAIAALPIAPHNRATFTEGDLRHMCGRLGLIWVAVWFAASALAAGAPLEAFESWSRAYINETTPARRNLLLREGVLLAEARARALEDLVRHDPKRALASRIPAATRKHLPAEVLRRVEREISGFGEFAVVAALGLADEPVARIVSVGGEQFRAAVYGRREHQTTKYNISLHGIAIGEWLALDESPLHVLERADALAAGELPQGCIVCGQAAAADADQVFVRVGAAVHRLCSVEHGQELRDRMEGAEAGLSPYVNYSNGVAAAAQLETAAADTWSTGLKRVLVIRVDFNDVPGEPLVYGITEYTTVPLTAAIALERITNHANRFFQEASYRRTGVDGAVTPVLRMPRTAAYYATNDNYFTLHSDARAAASSAGFSVTNYDRVAVVFSSLSSVPGSKFFFGGRGEVAGKNLWLHGWFSEQVVHHELGHTYGVWHAGAWVSRDRTSIGPGFHSEYGDPFDMMGDRGQSHFNPWFKSLLHWLDPADIIHVTGNGTYRVFRFDHVDGSGIRALKITRDTQRNYWIGLRQLLTNTPTLLDGAYVLWGYNYNTGSELLDMTPRSSRLDHDDAGLRIGATFLDTEMGILIAPLTKGGSAPREYLDIHIRLDAFPPRITTQPASQIAYENSTVTFTVSADSSEPVRYQWFHNGSALPGASAAVLSLPNVATNQAGLYWVIVTNIFGSATSAVASLTVTTPFGLALDVLDLRWRTGGNAPWTWQSADTHDGVDAAHSGAIGNNQVSWLETTVQGPGLLTFWWTVDSQRNGDYLRFTGGGFQAAISGSAGWRQQTFSIPAGTHALRWSYEKDSSGLRGDDRGWLDEVRFVTAPVFVSNPAPQRVPDGATVSFAAQAVSSAPVRYQWRFNGASLAGQTNVTLTISSASATNQGAYVAVASNEFAARTSAVAQLVVDGPPGAAWFAQIGNQWNDWAESIAVDPFGNCFVGGLFYYDIDFATTNFVSYGERDPYLAKYDPSGRLLWVKHGGSTNDEYKLLTVADNAGNAYVGFQFQRGFRLADITIPQFTSGIGLAKFSAEGDLRWFRYTGSQYYVNWLNSLALDAHGNVRLGGQLAGADLGSLASHFGNFDAKFDPAGNLLGVSTNGWPYASAWAWNSDGTKYVLGSSYTNYYLTKFGPDNTAEWQENYFPSLAGYIYDSFIAADRLGNVYVFITFEDMLFLGGRTFESQGGWDMALAKFSPYGQLEWAHRFGDWGPDRAAAITSDGWRIYFTALAGQNPVIDNRPVTGSGWRVYLACMDESGRLRWLTQYDNDAGRIHPVVDRGGNVYVIGEFYDLTLANTNLASRGYVDLFVQKLNTLGPPLNIVRDAGQTWLTWSALAPGFSVQESTNISAGWRARESTLIRVGPDFRFALPPTAEPRYFRLTK